MITFFRAHKKSANFYMGELRSLTTVCGKSLNDFEHLDHYEDFLNSLKSIESLDIEAIIYTDNNANILRPIHYTRKGFFTTFSGGWKVKQYKENYVLAYGVRCKNLPINKIASLLIGEQVNGRAILIKKLNYENIKG